MAISFEGGRISAGAYAGLRVQVGPSPEMVSPREIGAAIRKKDRVLTHAQLMGRLLSRVSGKKLSKLETERAVFELLADEMVAAGFEPVLIFRRYKAGEKLGGVRMRGGEVQCVASRGRSMRDVLYVLPSIPQVGGILSLTLVEAGVSGEGKILLQRIEDHRLDARCKEEDLAPYNDTRIYLLVPLIDRQEEPLGVLAVWLASSEILESDLTYSTLITAAENVGMRLGELSSAAK